MNFFLLRKGPATTMISDIVQKLGNVLEDELCCFQI
jgi:hypothetical protein